MRIIAIQLAEALKEREVAVVPGWLFCNTCYAKAVSLVNSEVS